MMAPIKPYLVEVFGALRGMRPTRAAFATFSEAHAAARDAHAQRPFAHVYVTNTDRCDGEDDGLTAEEREAVQEVLE